jgi:hypothetical protein
MDNGVFTHKMVAIVPRSSERKKTSSTLSLTAHITLTENEFSGETSRDKIPQTYRPNNFTFSQSVATRVLFRRENRVLRYALLQKRYVATPPLANFIPKVSAVLAWEKQTINSHSH